MLDELEQSGERDAADGLARELRALDWALELGEMIRTGEVLLVCVEGGES